MFIGREYKHFSKIPKGLCVKIVGKYIQFLRDSGNRLALLSYKHVFPSGMIAFLLKKMWVMDRKPCRRFALLRGLIEI
jgi:hypothetical protein